MTAPAIEALCARASRGEDLAAEDAVRLFQEADVLLLGGHADAVRRRLHGDRVTLVSVLPLAWGERPVAGSEVLPDEVRLEGPLPDGASLADARRMIEEARAARPGVPLRGVRPAELLGLARGAGLEPSVAAERLRRSGLATLAHPGPADDPCETLEGLFAAHRAGMPTDAPVVYGAATPGEDVVDALLALRMLGQATRLLRCAVPLPDHPPDASPLEGTSGIEDLRVFALARLLLGPVPRVAVEAAAVGPKLGVVALSFGADTVAGALAESTVRLLPSEAENPRPFNTDRARLLLAEAGREPAPPPPFPA